MGLSVACDCGTCISRSYPLTIFANIKSVTSACMDMQADQGFCYLLIRKYNMKTCYKWNFNFLDSLCSYADYYGFEPFCDPEARFAHVAVKINIFILKIGQHTIYWYFLRGQVEQSHTSLCRYSRVFASCQNIESNSAGILSIGIYLRCFSLFNKFWNLLDWLICYLHGKAFVWTLSTVAYKPSFNKKVSFFHLLCSNV